ncbi:hypothetical protein HYH02_011710 [Chlamydomonas schloesseri]|uniref:Copper-containing nitrite reductase n=1 Tax=Chlamydomonas schloesseri TaxID=2026947 RepID=A0A835SZ50_9CHLO|nr:hypothetical protein HYH02_011710 [Chlamydomonas schloesseri]|eukprot:KAG2435997.1 hypothetical protein HYH02_011710 [Chlamydomonas schloesseri]
MQQRRKAATLQLVRALRSQLATTAAERIVPPAAAVLPSGWRGIASAAGDGGPAGDSAAGPRGGPFLTWRGALLLAGGAAGAALGAGVGNTVAGTPPPAPSPSSDSGSYIVSGGGSSAPAVVAAAPWEKLNGGGVGSRQQQQQQQQASALPAPAGGAGVRPQAAAIAAAAGQGGREQAQRREAIGQKERPEQQPAPEQQAALEEQGEAEAGYGEEAIVRIPGEGPNPFTHPDPVQERDAAGLPLLPCGKSQAPAVPPPTGRNWPAHLVADVTTITADLPVSPLHRYTFWTFDGRVPGPLLRARVGDVLELRHTNKDRDGVGHNIDFHAVTGPGGGAPVTYAEEGETKIATFKLLHPGLFIYHCAAAPVPTHISNGMYGLVLVEPEGGLPPVDKEFYVVQSEIYATKSTETKGMLEYSYVDGLDEKPLKVVFNGAEGALQGRSPLVADQNDRVRIYFGNAGPNLISSFHVIGNVFDKVYREGDLVSPPARSIQTTLVPAGGAAVVEFDCPVPGNYTLLDHSIFRMEKGAIGFLKVRPRGGDRRRDIYDSVDPPLPCPGCKLHP